MAERGRKRKKVKIIPIGGLDRIGQNMTLIECDDQILVVDCGVAFPGSDMLGIDLIIPNFDYLRENREKLVGVVLTHGHEDHIGALPYFLREFQVPVYGTSLTLALVENKMQETNVKKYSLTVVKPGDVVTLGCFKTEFIRTNHSIGDATALAISTPVGVIVHTGDFKVDYTPIHGSMIDLPRFAELGKKEVLALMSDSTNAERPGYTMSERTVGKTLLDIFDRSEESRIIVATFASNVDRVQQIFNAARDHGRKVVVMGRSMINVVNTAMETGYLEVPEGILIEIGDVNDYPDEEIVIITTGSQGEPLSALARMASGEHRNVTIKAGDKVIFSSKPVPGNEKTVTRVINELMKKGAEVVYENAHVSGHASQEELKLVYSLLKPKYFIPVHGEYKHLLAHKNLIQEMGHPEEDIFLMSVGDVLELDKVQGEVTDHMEIEDVLVDGLGVGDVGNIVLRDRKLLAENGLLIIVLTLKRGTGLIEAGPDIVSRGFVYVRESESLMEGCRKVVMEVFDMCKQRSINDWGSIKTEIRDALREYLWRETKRSPMILPIITEVR
ncbi:MAG TPA: ribonuclease J [Candidatus Faecimorpha stercoravium]|nr:ribonuclease J [Candidatus Faecimorpha stercoravium]